MVESRVRRRFDPIPLRWPPSQQPFFFKPRTLPPHQCFGGRPDGSGCKQAMRWNGVGDSLTNPTLSSVTLPTSLLLVLNNACCIFQYIAWKFSNVSLGIFFYARCLQTDNITKYYRVSHKIFQLSFFLHNVIQRFVDSWMGAAKATRSFL